MSTAIRAILLDAGNTLLFVDPERVLRVLRDEGVEADRTAFREAEYRARRTLAGVVEDGHRGTEDHVWEHYFLTLFEECGVPPERMDVVGRRLQRMHRENHLWTHVEEGTHEALEALAGAGYRLAVVSNADGRVEDLLERAGLRSHLEFVVDSHAVGVEKPDPEIFRHALRRLGLEAGDCLYVGDLYPVDVVGAREAGLEAVLLDPFDRLEAPVDRIPSVTHLPAYLEEDGGLEVAGRRAPEEPGSGLSSGTEES